MATRAQGLGSGADGDCPDVMAIGRREPQMSRAVAAEQSVSASRLVWRMPSPLSPPPLIGWQLAGDANQSHGSESGSRPAEGEGQGTEPIVYLIGKEDVQGDACA